MTVTNKHPVIIHSLERKIIGERMLHTLLLTDPDFYEELRSRADSPARTTPPARAGSRRRRGLRCDSRS